MANLRLVVSGIPQKSGWSASLWALVAAILEAILVGLNSWPLPPWMLPFVPVISAVIGFALNTLRRTTTDVKTVQSALGPGVRVQPVNKEGDPVTPKGV